jgi:hypothetical protein
MYKRIYTQLRHSQWPVFRSSITQVSGSINAFASAQKSSLTVRPHADISITLSMPTGLYTPTITSTDTQTGDIRMKMSVKTVLNSSMDFRPTIVLNDNSDSSQSSGRGTSSSVIASAFFSDSETTPNVLRVDRDERKALLTKTRRRIVEAKTNAMVRRRVHSRAVLADKYAEVFTTERTSHGMNERATTNH